MSGPVCIWGINIACHHMNKNRHAWVSKSKYCLQPVDNSKDSSLKVNSSYASLQSVKEAAGVLTNLMKIGNQSLCAPNRSHYTLYILPMLLMGTKALKTGIASFKPVSSAGIWKWQYGCQSWPEKSGKGTKFKPMLFYMFTWCKQRKSLNPLWISWSLLVKQTITLFKY